jgi:hypothetical protein
MKQRIRGKRNQRTPTRENKKKSDKVETQKMENRNIKTKTELKKLTREIKEEENQDNNRTQMEEL